MEQARRRRDFAKRIAEETSQQITERRRKFKGAQQALRARLMAQTLVRLLDVPKGYSAGDLGAGLARGGAKRHAEARCELPVRVVSRP
eukprot:14244170-Alexandrium_andersonii.AAC.1